MRKSQAGCRVLVVGIKAAALDRAVPVSPRCRSNEKRSSSERLPPSAGARQPACTPPAAQQPSASPSPLHTATATPQCTQRRSGIGSRGR